MNSIGLDVRKLVALDMVFHGKRFILVEFAAGVVIALGLAILSLARSYPVFGLPMLWIGLNYVPLLMHAIDLARRDTAREEVAAELADMRLARSYSWRQLWILVPFAVVWFALTQRSARPA